MYQTDILETLNYYIQSRNVALRVAKGYSAPITAEAVIELRFYYSSCLSSIVSLTEYLSEKTYPYYLEFLESIRTDFIFEGFSDGEQNYSFLRGLRNMVVHRGYDLTRESHLDGDKPYFILPEYAASISGKTFYKCYERYLPTMLGETIEKIDSILSAHIDNYVSQIPERTAEEIESEIKLMMFADTFTVPAEAKAYMLDFLGKNNITGFVNDAKQRLKLQLSTSLSLVKTV
ncbi:hypothetical protein [Pseudomonas sp. BF-R-01]|uniref:hypothetical protein n=1 Tax=Pseudomonas sp. BF-R-01 TaxID=2832365 RepID=UPI001CBD85C3|nr:hypothetical protein [Pseudomonas sp. BF-R-01]